MLYKIETSHPSLYISNLVEQEDSVATLSNLSLTMVEAGAKLQRQYLLMPGIKGGLVLINMAAKTLQM